MQCKLQGGMWQGGQASSMHGDMEIIPVEAQLPLQLQVLYPCHIKLSDFEILDFIEKPFFRFQYRAQSPLNNASELTCVRNEILWWADCWRIHFEQSYFLKLVRFAF